MSGMHRDRVGEKRRKKISAQRILQVIAVVLVNGYMAGFREGRIFAGRSKAFCVPVLNCYSCPGAIGACPIGALQTSIGSRRHFPFYVLGTLMLFGVILGRAVCGLLCPFGFIQDLLHKIPVPKCKVPIRIDRVARYIKYMVLVLAVFLIPALFVAEPGMIPPYFCKYICPAGTLEGGLPLMAANPLLRELAGALFTWKMLVLVLVLAASMLIHRPFCRYLCPLGAFYSLFNRFSFYQMHINRQACIGCRKCERSCPMEVEVTRDINSPECIRCGKCRAVCPTGAISAEFAGTRRALKHLDIE